MKICEKYEEQSIDVYNVKYIYENTYYSQSSIRFFFKYGSIKILI